MRTFSEIIMKKFYEKTKNSDTRPLLIECMKYLPQNTSEMIAYDLGCGVGHDTIALQKIGYKVKACDISSDAFKYMDEIHGKLDNVEQIVSSLENLSFTSSNLINASLVLPFVDKNNFDAVMKKIIISLNIGGIFIGNFFGLKDDWANKLVCKPLPEIRTYFKSFDILYFKEIEDDMPSVSGPMKHWHIIDIICKKK